MELRIAEASEETQELLAAWRYPPPYDFKDSGPQARSGWTKYVVRVFGAADRFDELEDPVCEVADRLSEITMWALEADAGDLVCEFVFDVPDDQVQQSGSGDDLLIELRKVVPSDLSKRLSLSSAPVIDESDPFGS